MNERIWTRWPQCTQCGWPRQTVCPTCGAAGCEFQLAEYLAPAEPMRPTRRQSTAPEERNAEDMEILLVCGQCDEAFTPQFYRVCAKCGHDAGDGIQIDPHDGGQVNGRVVLALQALILVCLAFVLYFWMLLRHR